MVSYIEYGTQLFIELIYHGNSLRIIIKNEFVQLRFDNESFI